MITVSTLYLVATPIGNLEDISARALRILSEVSLILAEDTRQTRKLLTHFDIHAPFDSYHEHNKLEKLPQVLTALITGDVALVSDAGTPLLNDPGHELVQAALEAGHRVSPIPGPSAPICALVASGLPANAFLYLGYVPRKSPARRQLLEEVSRLPYTLIFLETPHRLLESLNDLSVVLGDRKIAVARELTKLHEEFFRGTLGGAQAHFSDYPPRGEITLVIAGYEEQDERWSQEQLLDELQASLDRNEPPAQIAKQYASRSGWPRRQVYQLVTQIQKKKSSQE